MSEYSTAIRPLGLPALGVPAFHSPPAEGEEERLEDQARHDEDRGESEGPSGSYLGGEQSESHRTYGAADADAAFVDGGTPVFVDGIGCAVVEAYEVNGAAADADRDETD